MKKIISGKMYNTETAKLIFEKSNRDYVTYGDYNYKEETIYLKKTGEFFLHGVGGAGTCYSELIGGCLSAGESIEPLTVDEAKAWIEDNAPIDVYIQAFGTPEE